MGKEKERLFWDVPDYYDQYFILFFIMEEG